MPSTVAMANAPNIGRTMAKIPNAVEITPSKPRSHSCCSSLRSLKAATSSEMPIANAQTVFPLTPLGTLVTVQA